MSGQAQVIKRLRDPVLAQKLAIVLLLSGLALLLVEVRFEHQVVLAKNWRSWIPLVYTAGMVVAGGIGLLWWQSGGRKIILCGFASGAVVGLFGFWFHSKGQPIAAVLEIIKVILMTPGRIATDAGGPPVLAPLSIVGLGILGVIICLPRCSRTHVQQPASDDLS